jgi:hypothetical protein
LAVGAEVVGRDTGHAAPFAVLVEQEQLLMLPDVRAIVSDEHRQVTEQEHAEVARVAAQALPLSIEQQLYELVVGNFLRQMLARGLERGRLAAPQLRRPVEPRLALLLVLQRGK